jgi:uncharacterized protein (DUF427 family)
MAVQNSNEFTKKNSYADKRIKIPGPDHPITITRLEGIVRIKVGDKTVAESSCALILREQGYPPVYYILREDADISLLVRTTHYTYCPYKGDSMYYSIPSIGFWPLLMWRAMCE